MIRNAISRAFILPLSAAVISLGLASDLEAAPAAPPSMSSLMHLDHAADLRAAADMDTIVLKNFHFAPTSLTVPAGTTVTWENQDGEPHTVVSMDGLFRSGGLDQNDVFTFTFDTPGTYRFLCSIHPQMMGTIVVK
jgi:plastocyanin